MASSISTRLWSVFRDAGRPFPRLTDDDVLDFVIVEAIRAKVGEEMRKADNEKQGEDFRGSHKGLTIEQLQQEAAARG